MGIIEFIELFEFNFEYIVYVNFALFFILIQIQFIYVSVDNV